MSKLDPITLRAASLTLTGSAAVVVGTVSTDAANATSGAASLGSLSLATMRCAYARHASSTTGRPVFVVELSMDPPTTAAASVANWQQVYLADLSAGSGVATLYPELQQPTPTASGSTIFATHAVNVSCAHWMRVKMYDLDAANPGAVSSLVFGGST